VGYYVTYEGEITFPSNREDEIVAALKALNHRHDLKTGGRSPRTGDPYEDLWFSWLPSRYHEDERLDNVESFLIMLGFDVNSTDADANGYTTIAVTYDNKIGSEEVFLNELAKFGWVDIYATGEDGDRWRYLSKEGDLLQYNGYVSYDDLRPTSTTDLLEQRAERSKFALDSQASV
jgi:hypothetical protein